MVSCDKLKNVMFDWYDGLVGYDAGRIDTGRVIVLAPGGEVTLITDRWDKAVGSYDEHIRLRPDVMSSDMAATAAKYNLVCSPVCFRMQGNPSKFLQGHNVFGASVKSLGPAIRDVVRNLPEKFRPADALDDRWPAVHRMRVDVTTSIRMDDDRAVHEWISHAQIETRSKHRQRQSGLTGATTVSWGIGSKRWSIVAYCKSCELAKHKPKSPEMYDDLAGYADGLLRIELRLYRLELKDRGTLDESLIWEFFDRIEVGVMRDDIEKNIAKLRQPVRMVYTLWLDGHDVSPASGLKRATFYKYRKEIIDATGQDISLPPVKRKAPAGSREKFSAQYLQEHEEKEVPAHLKKYLYQPGNSPIWPAH